MEDEQQILPFPTMEMQEKHYNVFGLVTNIEYDIPGDEIIHFLYERCRKSEEVHAVMKEDLPGGKLP